MSTTTIKAQPLPSDPLDIGLFSASAASFQGPRAIESNLLCVLLNYVMLCLVNAILHIPHCVCTLLVHVLSVGFKRLVF